MDLLTIVQEFEHYYEMKFGKKPVLTRKAASDGKSLPRLPPSGRAAASKRAAAKSHHSDDDDPSSSLSSKSGAARLGKGRHTASAPAPSDPKAGSGGSIADGVSGMSVKGEDVKKINLASKKN